MLHQTTPLAMAGMAEAYELFALAVAWCALLVASDASSIAFAKRSWTPVLIAGVAAGVVAILFMPWEAFAAVSVKDLEDPDVVISVRAHRTMASAWIAVVAFVVVAAVVVKVRRSRPARPISGHS